MHHAHELPTSVPIDQIQTSIDSYIQGGAEHPSASLQLLMPSREPVGAANETEVTSDAATGTDVKWEKTCELQSETN